MRLLPPLVPCAAALLLTVACGGDDEGSPAPSNAPVITNLQLAPATVPVAQQAELQGSVDFSDPTGDVSTLKIELRNPAGQAAPLIEGPLAGTGGITEGTAMFTLTLTVQAPGAYPLELWVGDTEGHDSNRLGMTLTAQ
ncbi:MAG: hypothetical protein IT376_18045 [Polyangiaceae bacterium]|nr:hypothetical protein [Polyangiaceae bacterium]